jgi:hypothetical protein
MSYSKCVATPIFLTSGDHPILADEEKRRMEDEMVARKKNNATMIEFQLEK